MNDRELIEAAARAVGIEGRFYSGAIPQHTGIYVGDNRYWNPLEDDAAALRLAVRLELEVRQVHFAAHAGWADRFWETERHGSDPCAATRRAIVRAAATLGAMGGA
jgi:hypothetical protein